MSLNSALQIGRSALTASQIGLSTAGNNIANIATPGYSRQIVSLFPNWGDRSTPGVQVGQGVGVRDIRRQIDSALQSRLWTGVSDEAAAVRQASITGGVEATIGELSGHDLSTEMGTFFAGWSEAANSSKSASLVVQQGDKLASFIKRMRSDLGQHRVTIDKQLGAQAEQANTLLSRVADLNKQISASEIDGSTANGLRDQRDQTITDLSAIMDVTTVEQDGGSIDVLVGSTPVVLGGRSRGVELARRTENGTTNVFFQVRENKQQLDVKSGEAGALLDSRTKAVDGTIDQLDTITSRMIFEINKLHSTGQNVKNLSETTGTLGIPSGDRSLGLNDPENKTFGGLPFKAVNGGFLVTVKQSATGATQTVRVDVDLDGTTNAGTPGTGDDTSPEKIRAALDAVPGIHAKFDADGKLKIDADAGYEFNFSEDSSGVLAVMGVNAYFTGSSAVDVGVRADLKDNPSLLMTGRMMNGTFVQNGTSLAVVGMQDKSIAELGDRTLRGAWTDTVQAVGVAASSSKSNAEASGLVRANLESQRAAVSGVSLDEESINLLNFQRQYQGAAKLISVADELTQTLMQLV